MSRKRKKKQQKRRPPLPLAAPKFTVGTAVRVKSGVLDPDFLDIPLGGWSGIIGELEVGGRTATYLVEWDQRTLDGMHPVYRKRCERDDLDVDSMWLTEDDLEPATGDPPPLEQPTNLVSRPLNPRDQDDRIRAILGLTSDDPLPETDAATLRRYHAYLAQELTFPFTAIYAQDTGPLETTAHEVPVAALADEVSEEEGLYCAIGSRPRLSWRMPFDEKIAQDLDSVAGPGGERLLLPLADLEILGKQRNRQLAEDYAYWFWNYHGDDTATLVGTSAIEPAPPSLRAIVWFLVKALLACSLLGALYGVVLGILLAVVEAAAVGALVGGVLAGLLGCWAGASMRTEGLPQTGALLGAVFGAGISGLVGALLGAEIPVLVVAYQGTLAGAVAGAVFGRLLFKIRRRPGGFLLGGLAGACLGAICLAVYRQPEAARDAVAAGALAGAVAGGVVFLVMSGTMIFLAARDE